MVSSNYEATRIGFAYIVSCLVQEIQNLRETLEFYKFNFACKGGPEVAPAPFPEEVRENGGVSDSPTFGSAQREL
jgi:hypothetical protein